MWIIYLKKKKKRFQTAPKSNKINKDEKLSWNDLQADNVTVITAADEGGTIVILDRGDYVTQCQTNTNFFLEEVEGQSHFRI